MAGIITLEYAQAQLAAYLAAERAVLAKQEYSIQGRTLKLADLPSIQHGIATWEGKVAELTAQASGRSSRVAVTRAGF